MSKTFANSINSNPLYAERAEQDASGNTITTTYATKSEVSAVADVPDVTSSDNGKVLKATYAEGSGSYAWADDQGSTYTAGDGIAIDNDEISAKIGEGLEIGSSSSTASISGSFVQTPFVQVQAYNIYNLVEIATMSSELVGAVDDSNGLSIVTSSDLTATRNSQPDPETGLYAPKDTYLAVASLSYDEVYNPVIGTNNVVCSIDEMVVFADVTSLITIGNNNHVYFDIGTQFNLSAANINTTYSTIAWNTVKANPSQYSIVLVVKDDNNVFGVDYLKSVNSSAAITVGTYSGQSTVTVNGVINVSNPLPSVGSGDDGKILKATYSGGTGSYDWESPPTEKNLVAGSNVSITSSGDNVTISATDTTYTFSTGLTNSSGTVTVTNPLPASSSSDEYKVLTVNSSGEPVWAASQGGGNEVPSVTSNDDGKILKASYSGGVGSYGWQTEARKPIVAGSNITITNNTNDVTIAATDTTYTFSTGLTNSSGTITVTNPIPAVTSNDDGKVLQATYSGGVGSFAWTTPSGGGGGGGEVPLPVLSGTDCLRFEFASSSFDPTQNSALSSMSWTKITADPSRNIWDFVSSSLSYGNLFKDKLTSSNLATTCKIIDGRIGYIDETWNRTLSNMFYYCTALTSVCFSIKPPNPYKGFDMSYMFYYCNALTNVTIRNTENSGIKVSNSSYMFYNCYRLKSFEYVSSKSPLFNPFFLDGSGQSMFENCSYLEDIRNIKFFGDEYSSGAAYSTSKMFSGCSSLKHIESSAISGAWKSSDCYAMFSGCASLEEVPFIIETVGPGVTIGSMFYGCYTLKGNVTLIATNVTNASQAFIYCYSLNTVKLINAQSITSADNMCYNCKSLLAVPSGIENAIALTSCSGMLYNCVNIEDGAKELYDVLATYNISTYGDTFTNCSSNIYGNTDLSQIPVAWGGTAT